MLISVYFNIATHVYKAKFVLFSNKIKFSHTHTYNTTLNALLRKNNLKENLFGGISDDNRVGRSYTNLIPRQI